MFTCEEREVVLQCIEEGDPCWDMQVISPVQVAFCLSIWDSIWIDAELKLLVDHLVFIMNMYDGSEFLMHLHVLLERALEGQG